MVGACVAAAFDALFFLIFPAHWIAVAIAIPVFSFVMVYSKPPPLVSKVSTFEHGLN
jgi:hypothetical protein